jgi:hypothetical protein
LKAEEDDENNDKQNESNFEENRNEVPTSEQQQPEIEYGPPEVLDYHPLPSIQKSAKVAPTHLFLV